jgi:hypothetical protein
MYLMRTLIAVLRGKLIMRDGKEADFEERLGVVFWFAGFGLSLGLMFACIGHFVMHGSVFFTVAAGVVGLLAGAEASCIYIWRGGRDSDE